MATLVQLLTAALRKGQQQCYLPACIGNRELEMFLATLNQLHACFLGPQVPDTPRPQAQHNAGAQSTIPATIPASVPGQTGVVDERVVPGVSNVCAADAAHGNSVSPHVAYPVAATPVAGGGTQGQLGPQDMQIVPLQLQHTQSVLDIPNAQPSPTIYQTVSPCTARFFPSPPGVAMPELWPTAGSSQGEKSEPTDVSFGGVLADEEMVSVLQAIDDREDIEGLQSAKQHGMLVVHAASKRRLAGNPVS